MDEAVLVTQNLQKIYRTGPEELHVLRGLNLEVSRGEVVAVVGASGTGKSTLLHLLGGLDRPTEGTIFLEGKNLQSLSKVELAGVRNRKIGFVFQFHYLLPEFTAMENIRMPALITGQEIKGATLRAETLLQQVGLAERKMHKPSELSGGEQQRAAIARALMNDPLLILADEPTGNLDRFTAEGVYELLSGIAKQRGKAFVIATHNEAFAQKADRILRLVDGRAMLVES